MSRWHIQLNEIVRKIHIIISGLSYCAISPWVQLFISGLLIYSMTQSEPDFINAIFVLEEKLGFVDSLVLEWASPNVNLAEDGDSDGSVVWCFNYFNMVLTGYSIHIGHIYKFAFEASLDLCDYCQVSLLIFLFILPPIFWT